MVNVTIDENIPLPKSRRSGRSAKIKGATGEREIARLFIECMERVERQHYGAAFDGMLSGSRLPSQHVKRNTLQSDRGGCDLAGVPLLAVEVKRVETLNVPAWWQQCVRQAEQLGLMPVLVYRQSRKIWQVRTWMKLSCVDGNVTRWVIAETDIVSFLGWYQDLYARHLKMTQ